MEKLVDNADPVVLRALEVVSAKFIVNAMNRTRYTGIFG